MATRKLSEVRMGGTWTSYVAAAQGSLLKAGWYDGDVRKLMGDTGIGFHFIVHTEACPSSVTVYNWTSEHIAAMDRIGVHSDVYCYPVDKGMNTSSLLRRDAADRIRSSIDAGRPVIVWAPTQMLEFGIIWGYDDADRAFSVADCARNDADPLPYENLGTSQVPWLFYQILREKVPVDPEVMCARALAFGVSEWRKDVHSNPLYASGRRAYENLIALLKARKWNPFGLGYLYAVYACAKDSIASYLLSASALCAEWRPIEEAAASYKRAAKSFRRMAEIYPFSGPQGPGGRPVEDMRAPELIRLAEESLASEEAAFTIIGNTISRMG